MSSFNISLEGVNAVSWTISSVALALTGGRYYIRWRLLGGFRSDDVAHLCATLLMVGQVAMYTGFIPILQAMLAFEADPTPAPGRAMPNLPAILASSTADGIILVVGLLSVRMSYMLLYRHIFNSGVSRTFSAAWWGVLAFNIAAVLACIAGRLTICGGDPAQLLDWAVCESPSNIPRMRALYIWTYASIVAPDLATMALPLYGIHGLQMRASQKIAIATVLCLSLVTIAFETLRLVMTFTGGDALDVFWQNLELEIAVIVSALPVYYSLINWRRGRLSNRSGSSGASSRRRLLASRSKNSYASKDSYASKNSYSAATHSLPDRAWPRSHRDTASSAGGSSDRDSLDTYKCSFYPAMGPPQTVQVRCYGHV